MQLAVRIARTVSRTPHFLQMVAWNASSVAGSSILQAMSGINRFVRRLEVSKIRVGCLFPVFFGLVPGEQIIADPSESIRVQVSGPAAAVASQVEPAVSAWMLVHCETKCCNPIAEFDEQAVYHHPAMERCLEELDHSS